MPFFNKKKNDKELAIIGLGSFGGSLARRLETLGLPILGIDIEPRQVKEIADEITEAVVLDATDEELSGRWTSPLFGRLSWPSLAILKPML